MPGISTVKNAVQTVVKKDKWLKAIFAGIKSLILSFSRVFYAFWLQTTGLVYVVLTLGGINYFIRQHGKFSDRWHFWVPVIFTIVCASFTVQSFTKAKRTLKKR